MFVLMSFWRTIAKSIAHTGNLRDVSYEIDRTGQASEMDRVGVHFGVMFWARLRLSDEK